MCAGVVSGTPAYVDACSPPPPWTYRTGLLPQDGAMGVPTNVELLLRYYPGYEWYEVTPTDPILRVAGGPAVELSIETIFQGSWYAEAVLIVRPTAPLEPLQDYEILDRIGDGTCAIEGECTEHVVIGTFRTGGSADATPPAAAVITESEIYCAYCYNDGCCGPYEETYGHVKWIAASDDGPFPVRYDVYAGGARVAARISGTSFAGPVRSYRIDSVDAAGNVTVGTAVPAPEGVCEFPGPEGDGGAVVVPADGGTAASSGGGGCSTVPGPPAALPGWILALIALAAWQRRSARA
jgi:hypothetical protein